MSTCAKSSARIVSFNPHVNIVRSGLSPFNVKETEVQGDEAVCPRHVADEGGIRSPPHTHCLARSGCYNKNTITWTAYKQQKFIPYSDGSYEVQDEGTHRPTVSVSDKSPLPGLWAAAFLLCPHMGDRARELSGLSFIRALIPFMRVPFSGPKRLPKAPSPNTITLGD